MYTKWLRQLCVEAGCDTEKAMDPAQAFEFEMVSRQKAMAEGIARGDSDIQRYYENATIFVTGGSGFLGKQLVEKLFRACNIKRVYLLLRPKKGMEVQERLKEILEDPKQRAQNAGSMTSLNVLNAYTFTQINASTLVTSHIDQAFLQVYSILLKQQPSFPDRITCLQGDVAETKLGLSDQDWSALANEVDMMFHVAATTRFDESLRVATLINVRGTREALRLARDCKKLRSLVYVSTAYSHATSDKIGQAVYEEFYPSPIPPEKLIDMAETMDAVLLDEIAPKLTAGWPNTYTFAKAVAEEQVRLTAGGLPVCIVRPSIVISAHYEPAPGWLEMSAARSASGFLLGSGLGLIHVMQTTPTTDLSLVPVDYVNNAVIAAGWGVGTKRQDSAVSGESETNIERSLEVETREHGGKMCGESETKIYNVVMSQENKLTWEILRSYYMSIRTELPMPSAIYLTYVFCVQSYPMFLLLTVLLHLIPAYIVDGVLGLVGGERRFVQIYKKIFKLSVSLSYFLNTTYYLDGKNTEKLYQKLSPIDKTIFLFDIKNINWFEYCKVWCIGVRKYLIQDGLKNTEFAKKKQFWFQYFNYLVISMYVCAIWFVISNVFKCLTRLI